MYYNKYTGKQPRGYSLAEVLIALSILSIATVAMTQTLIFVIRSNVSVGNYLMMNKESRIGLEYFGRDMRMTKEVRVATPTSIEVLVEGLEDETIITYQIETVTDPEHDNKTTKALVRTTDDGDRKVLFYHMNALVFEYFDMRDNATTLPTNIKKVQIDAEMLRKVQQLENTNHVLSARFTMRNRIISS